MQYLLAVQEQDTKIFDLDTVTVGDFSVKMDIDQTQFENFKTNHVELCEEYDHQTALAFKKFLMVKIPELLGKHYFGPIEDLSIAEIHFGFNNTDIIKLLRKRGY